MDDQLESKILSVISMRGPVLPIDVAKAVGKDLLFAGALLSQLVSKRLLKLSYAKIGGSPVYYQTGQEAKLSVLYSSLPDKEKEAYNLLKENKILMDKNQEPSIRVALRSIKDFAVPFETEVNSNKELFWRWHTSSNEELSELFHKKEEQKTIQTVQEEPKLETSTIELKEVEKPKVRKAKPKIKNDTPNNFLVDISNYLKKNEMQIIEEIAIKKNKESHFVVKVPSQIGELHYFVVARDKNKINEGDISLAYHEGQKRKLPVLFLSSGEMIKKAEKYIEDNMKGFVVFRRIDL
ncbi:MAG: hypothetical protein Q8R00_03095 [Candidatus Nanoarchaeia archaeon]|nr:hypothetical protein [Candidatus Nanoarchaeia archaeon]